LPRIAKLMAKGDWLVVGSVLDPGATKVREVFFVLRRHAKRFKVVLTE